MTTSLERLTAALADRYDIEGELGAGGMATVYLARDVRHNGRDSMYVYLPAVYMVLGPELSQDERVQSILRRFRGQ